MADAAPTQPRGRGKSRGGLGKYLRARGRGRGRGRPAEFSKRLVLEDEEEIEIDPDSEEAKEFDRKYSRRQLGSNADRYVEPEPELNSDGEVEEEPEVDLSNFLARQRLDDVPPTTQASAGVDEEDDGEVDATLAQLLNGKTPDRSRKGKAQHIEWDDQLDDMAREKAAAEAQRDLKNRFRANAEKQHPSGKPAGRGGMATLKGVTYVEAPPLPTETAPPEKKPKEQMEDFLDDLLG
ncbi:hypothetical protein BD410DRAFT_836029 [Rickenella mellea]|uniref:Uncharacterized protein n=1 Tax=Rickenella mellea TaxID=50990 RepID=A0A4Y7QI68_9AGAM|nr:hypothetical protein BD410DRAFT_836029 [Rickenella mellea]